MEAGEGGASLRLGGAGVIRLDEPRLSLRLEGKRIDIDSFILSAAGREMLSRAGAWAPPPLSFPIDLDLAVSSIGLGQEELSNLALKATLLRAAPCSKRPNSSRRARRGSRWRAWSGSRPRGAQRSLRHCVGRIRPVCALPG